jgi:helicase-like protein
MSATPIINNLMEGRSMLQMMSGKVYDDVAISQTIPNAVNLHTKLSLNSIREKRQYIYNPHLDLEVQAPVPSMLTIRELKSNPLSIEKLLTDARIPKIIENIKGQTIIYTEYVTEIIEKIKNAVEQEGFSYALYTGEMKVQRFKDKKVQVLIASRPISTGVDELQYSCNRLIINTLPWTNAQYEHQRLIYENIQCIKV